MRRSILKPQSHADEARACADQLSEETDVERPTLGQIETAGKSQSTRRAVIMRNVKHAVVNEPIPNQVTAELPNNASISATYTCDVRLKQQQSQPESFHIDELVEWRQRFKDDRRDTRLSINARDLGICSDKNSTSVG